MRTANENRIEIHCSDETKQEFMKTKADIAADLSHEEALQYLIEFYREKSVLEDRGTV